MKSLNHPNILSLYETVVTPEYFCMILEYASGGDFLEYISSQKKVTFLTVTLNPYYRLQSQKPNAFSKIFWAHFLTHTLKESLTETSNLRISCLTLKATSR
jgi:serine/threonine protein kinase